MKVLYISSRLNVPDGSSVHGRAFFNSVQKIGHEIVTYPEITPLPLVYTEKQVVNKNIIYFLRKFRPRTIIFWVRQINFRIADSIDFISGLFVSVKDFFKLRTIIKNFDPDIIVYRKYLFNFAVVWASRMYNVPCVAEVNSLKLVESKLRKNKKKLSTLSRWSETYPLLKSDHVFCVSSAIKRSLDTFLDPKKVSVIPNGVDADVFDRNRYNSENIKKSLGLQDKTVLGYAGSYQAWHDVQKSVDLISMIKDSDPSFHLLLIGNGQDYEKIARHIEEQDLASYVTQIDYVPHTEMPKYLAAFDIAIMTYPIFDGFYFSPLKMYEYMAMAIPVVSTDIGQIRDAIDDGNTGLLVKQPTVVEFMNAIFSITKVKGRLDEMGGNARRAAIEKHSWVVNASQVMDLCSMILNSRDRSEN